MVHIRRLSLVWLLLLVVSESETKRRIRGRYSDEVTKPPTTLKPTRDSVLWLRKQLNKPWSVESFCHTLVPPLGVKPRNTESPYTIEYNRRENNAIMIRVLGNDTLKWQGFAFQIHHEGLPIGKFFMADYLKDNRTRRLGCHIRYGIRHRVSYCYQYYLIY